MHERRYARHGGWRRNDCNPKSRFGYGGPGYGGFGRKGMYGGYKSHYSYYPQCLCNFRNPFPTNNQETVITSNGRCGDNWWWVIYLVFILLIVLYLK